MRLSYQQEAHQFDFFAHTTQPLLSKTQWRRDELGLREGVAICRTAFSRRCKNGKRGNNLFIRQASSRHLGKQHREYSDGNIFQFENKVSHRADSPFIQLKYRSLLFILQPEKVGRLFKRRSSQAGKARYLRYALI